MKLDFRSGENLKNKLKIVLGGPKNVGKTLIIFFGGGAAEILINAINNGLTLFILETNIIFPK